MCISCNGHGLIRLISGAIVLWKSHSSWVWWFSAGRFTHLICLRLWWPRLVDDRNLWIPLTVIPMIDIQFRMLPRLPALLCKFMWMLVVFDIRYSEISCDVITHVVMTYQDRCLIIWLYCWGNVLSNVVYWRYVCIILYSLQINISYDNGLAPT